MKGISPIIATVLLIAFTVAVGGVVSIWLSGLTTTTTTTTGSAVEKQIICARSAFVVSEVTYLPNTSVNSTGDMVNITIKYQYGTEPLYYFNITLRDNKKQSLTITPVVAKNFNKTNPFSPGMLYVWNLNTSDTTAVTSVANVDLNDTLDLVRVSSKCQDDYPIIGECKSGQACMK